MTDNPAEPLLDQAAARRLTDELRKSLVISWNLLVEAYERRAWAALGYASWDAYTDAELGEVRLRLPRERRREVVASMAESNMSNRAIASALGIGETQVRRDRAGAPNGAPAPEPVSGEIITGPAKSANVAAVRNYYASLVAAEAQRDPGEQRGEATILGRDGKSYPLQPPTPRKTRRPLPDAYRDAVQELEKAIARLGRLHEDDRFQRNREGLRAAHRGDVGRLAEALRKIEDELGSVQ